MIHEVNFPCIFLCSTGSHVTEGISVEERCRHAKPWDLHISPTRKINCDMSERNPRLRGKCVHPPSAVLRARFSWGVLPQEGITFACQLLDVTFGRLDCSKHTAIPSFSPAPLLGPSWANKMRDDKFDENSIACIRFFAKWILSIINYFPRKLWEHVFNE